MHNNKKCNNVSGLSLLLIIVASAICLICTTVFLYGQYRANVSIQLAGEAVVSAMEQVTEAQQQIDYTAALTYLETAQQVYSENSMVKLTSLIYVFASTIILGYGAKVLRLGKSDKDELVNELYNQTSSQLSGAKQDLQKLIEQTKSQVLNKQDKISIIFNSSDHALQLCQLIQSCLVMLTLFPPEDNIRRSKFTCTIERAKIDMIHSMQLFCDFLKSFCDLEIFADDTMADMIGRNMDLLINSTKALEGLQKPPELNDDKAIRRLAENCKNLYEDWVKRA